ncbi:RpiB/LacA/LacB family sugar-phosphate isomerase [Planotetraspora kaengkrachanensis]|uniref:Ribose 5-phosphate isomerase B n=1 Tax=Planotetraspora kaengkrachanensis TaxID=575193 RepID=A0A8J3PY85_9ACTN|nr:RpiB/LacA/LacB family sugar-phosphate isomerase [Planotetraspora kaengkrachanensis]GIG83212.1 ribose 5-phosphate isomerase B [Planotetraspora kaengkrachanensis]
MRLSLASDSLDGVATRLVAEVQRRGHSVTLYGALAPGGRADWAWCCSAAAKDVASGRSDLAIVCCWTGTGASIAANKVDGVRAALCVDAATADGARRWNDANVLALSLRLTSDRLLQEILDAWFAGAPSTDDEDVANIAHLSDLES